MNIECGQEFVVVMTKLPDTYYCQWKHVVPVKNTLYGLFLTMNTENSHIISIVEIQFGIKNNMCIWHNSHKCFNVVCQILPSICSANGHRLWAEASHQYLICHHEWEKGQWTVILLILLISKVLAKQVYSAD